jgi:hypothetical protein
VDVLLDLGEESDFGCRGFDLGERHRRRREVKRRKGEEGRNEEEEGDLYEGRDRNLAGQGKKQKCIVVVAGRRCCEDRKGSEGKHPDQSLKAGSCTS